MSVCNERDFFKLVNETNVYQISIIIPIDFTNSYSNLRLFKFRKTLLTVGKCHLTIMKKLVTYMHLLIPVANQIKN